MKRIKQELLDEVFIVNTPTEEKMHEVIKLLCDSSLSVYNFNAHEADTCIHYVPAHNDCYFGDRKDYELDGDTILDYDDIWEYCGGTIEIKDVNFDFNFDGISSKLFGRESFSKPVLVDDYNCNWGSNKEEEEMTKIENRIAELEQKVWDLELLEKDLKKAVKLDRQSVVLMDKLKKAKYEYKRFNELLKGYNALDNMYVSEVFKNGDYVVVKTIDGEVASSKPDKHDEFNMCSGFAFCNMKLGLDNDFYRHEINLALKDIEKRGL